MKARVLIFLFLILFSNTLKSDLIDFQNIHKDTNFWEDFSNIEKEVFIKTSNIDSNVLCYYNKRFTVKDNDLTIKMIETLTAKTVSKEMFVFYFYNFNQICLNADGAISECLGKYCQNMVLNNPEYVIDYFARNKMILDKYASYIGYELYFKEEGTSDINFNYIDFKTILTEKTSLKEKYSKVLMDLFGKIDTVMRNMD